jgi:hypothetical protein
MGSKAWRSEYKLVKSSELAKYKETTVTSGFSLGIELLASPLIAVIFRF